MHTVGGKRSSLGNRWVGVVLCAGSLAWFGCGSDQDDDQGGADTEADALTPAEPTQLLSYSCRQDPLQQSTPPGSAANLPKTFRQTQRLVGAAVNATGLDDPSYANTVATQFSQLTPENEMKWEAIEPERDAFDFTRADKIVAFAQQNGLKVRGHTLVWHSQLAPWVNELTGDDLRQAMLNHIRGVVTHYRETFPGVVVAYDVVNEARDVMNGMMGQMPIYRDSIFYRELGPDFIPEAFQAAHEADPDALLFYNDFGVEGMNGAKSTGMYNMVSEMVAQGVPIHGVGLQMHTGPTDQGPGATDFRNNIQRYADLGLLVDVTEMDVSLCSIGDNQLGRELQRYRYNRIVSACVDSPACRSVSLWGVSDPNSWLNDNGCTQGMIMLDTMPAPLAFAGDFGRKPAWWGIYDGLMGCTYQ
jgi:endo-1,4-beta-xylanase